MLWYLIAGLLLLLCLLLILPLSLTISLNEQGERSLCGRVMGICLYRSPKRKKRVRLRDYSERALQRRERRRLDRLQKKKKKKPGSQSDKQPPLGKPSLPEQISSVTELVTTILHHALRHARVTVDALAITVASPDAAQTALLYGASCAALSLLTEALHQFSRLHIRHPERYGVLADFASDRARADIRIRFQLRVHHLIHIALRTLIKLASRQNRQSKRK